MNYEDDDYEEEVSIPAKLYQRIDTLAENRDANLHELATELLRLGLKVRDALDRKARVEVHLPNGDVEVLADGEEEQRQNRLRSEIEDELAELRTAMEGVRGRINDAEQKLRQLA